MSSTTTPILDLLISPPAAPKRWIRLVVAFAIGGALGLIPFLVKNGVLLDRHWPAFNALLLAPTYLIAVAVHELGHLVAGKAVGIDMGGIAIGPLLLTKSGNRWVFEFKWERFFTGFFKPLKSSEDFRVSRYVWMVAGGPLASFLLAVVARVFVSSYGNGLWDWVGTVFWVSLFLGVLSTIPSSSGMRRNDGAQIWRLLRRPEQARTLRALLAIQTAEARGVRPRDWDGDTFEELLTVDPLAKEYLGCQLFAFYRFLDRGQESAALPFLENALGRCGKASDELRGCLFLESASACARIKNEPEKGRVWRERALPLVHKRPDAFQTVDASIAMAEERYEESLKLWQEASERLVGQKKDSGMARFALEKWAGFEAYCEKQITNRGVDGLAIQCDQLGGSSGF